MSLCQALCYPTPTQERAIVARSYRLAAVIAIVGGAFDLWFYLV